MWIGRERLDEDRSVSNYLLVSVRNEIYDWLSLKYNSAVVRCSAPPESEDYSADIEESMAVLETSGRLDRIISSMPPQRQKVFMMSRYRGMSSKEISEALDISVRTVERHIHLALKDSLLIARLHAAAFPLMVHSSSYSSVSRIV